MQILHSKALVMAACDCSPEKLSGSGSRLGTFRWSFRRNGSNSWTPVAVDWIGQPPVAVDVRVIVTSTRQIGAPVSGGRLQRDLDRRFSSLTLALPPLRERPEDIAGSVEFFYSRQERNTPRLSMSIMAAQEAEMTAVPATLEQVDWNRAKAARLRSCLSPEKAL